MPARQRFQQQVLRRAARDLVFAPQMMNGADETSPPAAVVEVAAKPMRLVREIVRQEVEELHGIAGSCLGHRRLSRSRVNRAHDRTAPRARASVVRRPAGPIGAETAKTALGSRLGKMALQIGAGAGVGLRTMFTHPNGSNRISIGSLPIAVAPVMGQGAAQLGR
jgi:hypothetical protein